MALKSAITFRHLLEALLAYATYGFFALLPLDTASAVGGWLGRNLAAHLGVSRRAYKHLELAMPELTEAQRKQIVRSMWDNLGRNLAETPHLKHLMKRNRISIIGWENLDQALAHGHGALIASGHFANWEVGPILFWERGHPVTTVYRRPNNPLIDPLLRYARRIVTPNLLAKGRQAASGIVKTLRQNGLVGLLVDQKMNDNAAMLTFFGRPAMTGLATAQLALKTNSVLLVGTYVRENGAYFKLHLHSAIPPSDPATMMQQVNDVFENHIRQYPGQWLWMHRRWDNRHKTWDTPIA